MSHNQRQLNNALKIMLLIFTLVSLQAFAQYSITKYSINNGGGVSENAGFKISSSIGQSATSSMNGGEFKISGGFWVGGENSDVLFTNGFE